MSPCQVQHDSGAGLEDRHPDGAPRREAFGVGREGECVLGRAGAGPHLSQDRGKPTRHTFSVPTVHPLTSEPFLDLQVRCCPSGCSLIILPLEARAPSLACWSFQTCLPSSAT